MSERQALLVHNHQRKRCTFSYRFQRIHSKGALLILFWDAVTCLQYQLMVGVLWREMSFAMMKIGHLNWYKVTMINENLRYFFMLLFPFMGLIADTRVGRYRLIITCGYLYIGIFLVCISGFVLIYFQYYTYGLIIFWIIKVANELVGAGIKANILPFNIDQLIGSSSEELSAVVHWHAMVMNMGLLVWIGIENITTDQISSQYFDVPIVCIIILVFLIPITNYFFKDWLDTTPQITNPIKLIAKVLNYARKNKYPRNRSALTYWEEDYPSRLDLGKEKYGGIFSEEQVEDVKTVLRLIPLLLIFLIALGFLWDSLAVTESFSGYSKYSGYSQHSKHYYNIVSFTRNAHYIITSLLILLYQFLIYPCFYNYIPSMLKRIGLGLIFALFTNILYLSYLWIGYFKVSSEDRSNYLHNSTLSLPIDYKWLLLPQTFGGIAYFLILVTSLEFVLAQSPQPMRGFMVGVWYAGRGLAFITRSIVQLPFHFLHVRFPGYYYIVSSVIVLIVFVLFLICAKCYKLRVRDNIVNIHQIVEDHFERFIEQSNEHAQELSFSSSSLIYNVQ